MFDALFFSKKYQKTYANEIGAMQRRYGDEALAIVQQRSCDRLLPTRDRQHWRRVYLGMKRATAPSRAT
jgi:hypothetical protein